MAFDPIRVGIIGVHPDQGWASSAHIPALKALPQYKLQALAHHQEDVAKAAAEKFDIPNSHLSTHDLVNDPEVDMVVVTVKVTRHRDAISKAIDAGKKVFSEWPLGINLAEAQVLRDLAQHARVSNFIGLQTRSAPAFRTMKTLISEGFVGRVLSATMIGSGIVWGHEMSDGFEYTLDPDNGAGMLQVPFAHSIDGLLDALGQRVVDHVCKLSNSRHTITLSNSGRNVPLSVPDQILLSARLSDGTALMSHFRGGLCQGTNFHVEVNGTEGDLLLTSPVGYVGIGGTRLQGARNGAPLGDLNIPPEHDMHAAVGSPAQNVAIQYARIANDCFRGTRNAPTFDDARDLHALIAALARGGSWH